jgi:hypothetical protein
VQFGNPIFYYWLLSISYLGKEWENPFVYILMGMEGKFLFWGKGNRKHKFPHIRYEYQQIRATTATATIDGLCYYNNLIRLLTCLFIQSTIRTLLLSTYMCGRFSLQYIFLPTYFSHSFTYSDALVTKIYVYIYTQKTHVLWK